MPPEEVYLPSEVGRTIRFGVFEVDLRSGELRRSGVKVKLQGQPFQVLLTLLERPGEPITREELRLRLWPADTFVDFEHSLNAAIKRLRDALGDSAEKPVFIETLPRRGYRFLAPVNNGTPARGDPLDTRAPVQATGSKRLVLVIGGLAVLIVAAVVAQRSGLVSGHRAVASMPSMKVVPFTTYPGSESDPAFSPDGKQIAFVWTKYPRKDNGIYVKLVGGEDPLRLTQGAGPVCFPTWSPDGGHISYQGCSSGSCGTFVVPALGGPERKLTSASACLGLSWSSDGKFLTFPAKDSAAEPWHIAVFSLDTMEQRPVTSPPANIIGDHHPSFSPDSKTVAFTRLSSPWVTDIYLASIQGGQTRRLTFDKTVIWGNAWDAEGQSLVISSHRGGDFGLWRVPIAGGTPERLSIGSTSAFYPSIALQGNRLAYRMGTLHPNIWRLALDASLRPISPAAPLMISSVADEGPQFSPDGNKIVFDSQRSGNNEIWVANADGSEPIRLTSLNVLSGTPRWSPDGKFIAFDSRPGDHSHIFVISAVGGAPRQITHGDFEASVPSWSRDGKWIYFTSNRFGIWQLFKVSTQGGDPLQVTKKGGFAAFESPDGSALYYWKDNDHGIWKMPLPAGEEKRILPLGLDWGRWAVLNDGIYFVDSNQPRPVISFFDFASHRISRIATIEKALPFEVPAFDVSPDGRTVLFLQVEMQGDIMLVENFR